MVSACLDSPIFTQYYTAFVCNYMVLLSAMSFAWIEPKMSYMTTCGNSYDLTSQDISWVVSIVELGCLIAPIPSGMLADRLGRKTVLLITPALFVSSWIFILMSSKSLLILARIIQGFAIGAIFTIVPLYIAEISQPSIRGRLIGHIQTMWYLGILFIYVSGSYLFYTHYCILCLVFSLLSMILLLTIHETPYYFLMKSMNSKAYDVMKCLRDEKVKEYLDVLRSEVEEEMTHKGFKQLFRSKSDLKALQVVLLVCATRYLTGMPSLINYASDTFGVSPDLPISRDFLTIGLGVLLTGTALVSSYLSDIAGRRNLLILSGIGCLFSHFFLGLYFYISEKTDRSPPHFLLYVGLVGFCVFSDIGLAPISQTLQAEMFPSSTRGVGGGVVSSFSAIVSFVNLKTYKTVGEAYGYFLNYWIYAVISFIGTILIKISFKETAGKSLHEINLELKKMEDLSAKRNEDQKIKHQTKNVQPIK